MRRARKEQHRSWRALALIGAACMTIGVGCSPAYAQQQPGEAPQAGASSDGGGSSQGGGLDVGDAKVPTTAMSDAKVRERVEFLLSGYEYFPTREDLDGVAVAGQMAPILRALSVDTTSSPMLCNRAVNALAYYQDDETIAHLRALALTDTSKLDRKLLRAARSKRYQAIVSYARAAGTQSLGDMEVLMQDDDVQIQLSAISAVGKHLGEQGKQVLEARMASESDPVILRELGKHVR